MSFWESFIGVFLPYASVAILGLGLIYKIAYWFRAPIHLHWELFPYPHTLVEQLNELVTEVLALRSLFTYNRKLWFPSWIMHWGIYLVVFWLALLLLGVPFAAYLGQAGGVLALAGSLLLILFRLFDADLRKISAPVEYFNLLFLFLLALSALISGILSDFGLRNYLLSLLTLAPQLPLPKNYLVPLLLFELFMMYIPFTRMAHFAAKFFTYHKVKWGEMK